MTRSPLVPPGRRARRAARVVLATSVVALTMAAAPLAAGAEEAAAEAPTLSEVLLGQVDGITAEAATAPADDGGLGVVVEITNAGDDPVEVAVPFDTLLVTETEDDQTLAVTPPPTDEVVEVAAAGGTPTLEFGPGTSTQHLSAYCTELDDGYPSDSAPLTPIDPAHAVLAATLRTATATGVDPYVTQDAVWWLTDEPSVPVADELHGVLEVDTAAFAADPYRVVPDTGYTPLWMREDVTPHDAGDLQTPSPVDDEESAAILDESFEGPGGSSSSGSSGVGAGLTVWAVLVGLVVVTSIIVATRAGRSRPAVVPVAGRMAAGWYPDPWGGGGHRYWDGRTWTNRVL